MLSITTDVRSGEVVFSTNGNLDEAAMGALTHALSRTRGRVPIVIDLSCAEVSSPGLLRELAVELSHRTGSIRFLGPTWATVLRRVSE
jgi:hypothetical protein